MQMFSRWKCIIYCVTSHQFMYIFQFNEIIIRKIFIINWIHSFTFHFCRVHHEFGVNLEFLLSFPFVNYRHYNGFHSRHNLSNWHCRHHLQQLQTQLSYFILQSFSFLFSIFYHTIYNCLILFFGYKVHFCITYCFSYLFSYCAFALAHTKKSLEPDSDEQGVRTLWRCRSDWRWIRVGKCSLNIWCRFVGDDDDGGIQKVRRRRRRQHANMRNYLKWTRRARARGRMTHITTTIVENMNLMLIKTV